MKTVFETNFIVMPGDCNYQSPMIFGGAFFSKMDLAAACCVDAALESSVCNSAVTHKYEGTFHAAAELGDIVFIRAEIVECRSKAIKITVVAHRKRRGKPERDLVASGWFVFVTKKDGEFYPHGLVLHIPY